MIICIIVVAEMTHFRAMNVTYISPLEMSENCTVYYPEATAQVGNYFPSLDCLSGQQTEGFVWGVHPFSIETPSVFAISGNKALTA
jgi:hypothetical protein